MELKKIKRTIKSPIGLSPWLIIGCAGILLIVVLVMAYENVEREKRYMSELLTEKGAAVIKAVEAGTRTGMMGMMWKSRDIQLLIEEIAHLTNVVYIHVVNSDGLVLASSNKELIGSIEKNLLPTISRKELKNVHWRYITREGRHVFEVYQIVRPLSLRRNLSRSQCMMGMRLWQGRSLNTTNWCYQWSRKKRIILVGFDPKPFEEARMQDIKNSIIISFVLVILGIAGVVSLFWMQGYYRTKKSLQDTTAIKEQLMLSLPLGLIATDNNDQIAFYNTIAKRITGIDLDKLLGKKISEVMPHQIKEIIDVLDKGKVIFEKELECEFTEKKVVPVSVTATRIINEQGEFIGYVLLIRDLREVRKLQEEIRRKEKLAAIGSLAAGVAHEIRNPLSSIKGIATYFIGKFSKQSSEREMAQVMVEEVERLNWVINELLEFARPPKLNLKDTNINEVISHSLKLIEHDAKHKKIDISFKKGADPIVLNIDPDRLTQCFLNLFLNSIQAMDNGGSFEIYSSISGQMVRIEIKDNGKGISPEHIEKIFDPYFTTKPQGTGLGLAIVYKIIEAHGGDVRVRSIPDKGCVFSILLPFKRA